ncbi:carbohydrate binding domain-containing protein [Neobacillus dielmonensis]|uniref:carbohydrate binding domain-containing protein n=1 Tax=Neobacillus dielmonensis TaxID=1347369 RepID=UPI0006934324|nr:carbohydrate binding domain-containing protein [Neobacillus dielmonensis]
MKKKSILYYVVLILVLSLFPVQTKVNAEEPVVAQLNNRGFKEAVEVGVGASDVALTSAVFGKENGKDVAYSTANGGKFNVVELQTNKLLFSAQLGEINQVWSHSLAPDGTVYIAGLAAGNVGELWSYSPSTRTVKKIGTPAAGHQLWSSTVDEQGNVYLGTYKETDGRVIQYKPSTGEFVDFGKVDDRDGSYVRSLAYHDGYLYAGLGVTGKVYRIYVQTREKEDITKNVPELIGKPIEQVKFAYDMAVAGNYLFVRFDDGQTNTLLFYNLTEQKWMDKKLTKLNDGSADDFGAFGYTQLPVHGDKAYVIYNRSITEIDLNTLESRNTGFNYAAGWRGGAIVDLGRTDLPGLSLVSLKRTGQVLVANFEKNFLTELPNVMEAKPLLLHNLGKGPDGNLYMTTYPGGPKGAQYNPKTNSFVSYSQGQAEGMAAGNGTDMYFGVYPGASIQKMNTETLKQETLFNIKDTYEQDRPYIMKFIENKLFIGTIPDYQKLGGALTIYDPATGARETHRNIVQDQSIVGLAYKDGLVYGSTTIRGGLDIQPTASKAKMFVWDVAGQKKVTEFALNIPELDQPPMISGLTFDSDGLLWGAVDGILFAMNPKTYEIVKYKNFYPEVKNRGMWRPVHILFGKDGLLYTDLAGKLTVVDPKSSDLKHVTLISSAPEVDFMALAEEANGNENIYFLENGTTVLKMIPVIDGGTVVQPPSGPVTEVVSVPISNAGFEEVNVDGKIPGWSSLFGNFTTNVSFEVSETRSKTGDNSLKVVDKSQAETVFAQTDPIPVEAGTEYTGSVNLFLEDGSASFFLRYYDEAGKQVGKDTDGVNIIHVRSGYKEWQTVTAKVVAPEGAKYARLFAGTSNYFTTNGAYYDDFKLTFEKTVEPEPEMISVPMDLKNAGFEAALEDESIPGWSLMNGDLAPGTSYEISQVQASKGRFSVKVADTTTSGSVYLQSDSQQVTPGTQYTATADMYLEDGRASFFMRFFDAKGKQVGGDTATSLVHVTSGHKEWQTVKATAVAPEGAVTARLFAGVSNAWTTNGVYYDNFSLSYEREVQPGDPEVPIGPAPVTHQWVKQGAKWYAEDKMTGKPVTGWLQEDQYTFYLDLNGQAKTSWLQKEHQWYYFDDNGVMLTGWFKAGNQWYFAAQSGEMQKGWLEQDGKKFYLNESGARVAGWLQLDGERYYFDQNGVMQTGEVLINNQFYSFSEDGRLVK